MKTDCIQEGGHKLKTWLSKEEEEFVKKILLDFLERASSPNAREQEIALLPVIAKVLLNNMTEYD